MPRHSSCKECKNLGFIQKLHTCSRAWPLRKEQMESADRQQQSVISDGGLQGNPSAFGSSESLIAYSLNKRRRWMLPALLEKAITHQEYSELDTQVPVSCFTRQVERDANRRGRNTATAMSLSSTVFGGAATIRPNHSNGTSFITDLAVKELSKSKKPVHLRGQKPKLRTHARGAQRNQPQQRIQESEETSKEPKLIAEARNLDWGVMYHIAVPNCNGSQKKRKCRFHANSRYEWDSYSFCGPRSFVEEPDVYALDEFCEIESESYAEFLDDTTESDTNTEEYSKPKKAFDLEDFFNQENRTLVPRMKIAETTDASPKDNVRHIHVVPGETKPLVFRKPERNSAQPQSPALVDDYQQTFLLAGQFARSDRLIASRSLTDVIAQGLRDDRILFLDDFSDSFGHKVVWARKIARISPVLIQNMVRPNTELIPEQIKGPLLVQKYPADSCRTFLLPEDMATADRILASKKMAVVATTGARIIFSDVKLDVATCVILTPTLFGLGCCVKGPETWLRYLPELTDMPSLMKKLLRPLHDASVSFAERLHSVESVFDPDVEALHSTYFLSDLLSSSHHLTNEDLATQLCSVCLDDSECVLKNKCGHVACKNCWKQHMMAKVSGGIATILCMEQKCNAPVDVAIIGLVAPWWALEAWQKRNLDVVLASKDTVWCQTPKCRSIFLLDSAAVRDTQTLLVCFRCEKRTCRNCQEEWHWPSPCAEAEKYHQLIRFLEDDPYHSRYCKKEKYFAQTKQCPTCHLVMEKGEGCNNMSCNCGAQFCWNCGRLTLEHYTNGEWVGCLRSIPLETIDVEEDTQLRWKEVAYRSAVQKRLLRYGLRFGQFKNVDADSKKAAYYAYHVIEYAYAYESQAPTNKLVKFVRREMQDLEFLVQLMLENQEKSEKKIWCHGKIKFLLLRIRSAFSSISRAA